MRRANLGRAELEILRYVAEHYPVTVREVAEHAAETQGKARTTILTVMERLRKKHYLSRRKQGGVYQYSPRVPVAEVLQGFVRQFVETTLQGAMSPFFAYLSKTADVSDKDLDELKRLVDELESQRKDEGPGVRQGKGDSPIFVDTKIGTVPEATLLPDRKGTAS
jgi:predicted transcriptional regulator